jgi:outer membrane protein OmpA-like peptidoglycan-associated protein
MGPNALLRRVLILALLITIVIASGCATRKFTRNELNALENDLALRLETDEKNIARIDNDAKELAEHVNAVEGKTNDNTSQINTLRGDLAKVDGKATDATNAARNAQSAADKANTSVASLGSSLDALLRNRGNYEVVSEKQIPFQFGSSKLSEDFEAPLSELAAQLKDNPDTFVVLEGRTDNVGAAAYNIQLGEKRNEAITRYLIVAQGVPMFKVYQTSFGKDQPIAPNDSKEGREKNRSVVVRVYRAKSNVATVR